MGASIGVDSV